MDGYVLEVQASLMSRLATTVVAPLLPVEAAPPPMTRLNPVFEIGGTSYAMVTQSLAAVPRRELGAAVGSLNSSKEYEVTNALDMLLSNC